MIHPTVKIAVLSVALLGASTVQSELPSAQDPVPAQDRDGPPKLLFEPGTHSAKDIIERSAKFLGRNYIYSDVELAGPTQELPLQNRLELERGDCEAVVEGLLYSMGLVLVPVNAERGIYEVIHTSGPKRGEIMRRAVTMSAAEVLENRHRKLAVQCTVDLGNINAMVATQQLRPLFAQSGGQGLITGAIGDGHSLVLAGYADSVAAAIELVAASDLDAAGPDAKAEEAGPSLRLLLEEIQVRLSALEKRVQRLEAAK